MKLSKDYSPVIMLYIFHVLHGLQVFIREEHTPGAPRERGVGAVEAAQVVHAHDGRRLQFITEASSLLHIFLNLKNN